MDFLAYPKQWYHSRMISTKRITSPMKSDTRSFGIFYTICLAVLVSLLHRLSLVVSCGAVSVGACASLFAVVARLWRWVRKALTAAEPSWDREQIRVLCTGTGIPNHQESYTNIFLPPFRFLIWSMSVDTTNKPFRVSVFKECKGVQNHKLEMFLEMKILKDNVRGTNQNTEMEVQWL